MRILILIARILFGVALLGYAVFVFKKLFTLRTPTQGVDLVEDPICHTYLARSKATEYRHQGKTYYFCGRACVSAFEKREAGG